MKDLDYVSVEYLSVEDLLDIGRYTIPDFRVRDFGLLQMAALRPKLTVYGVEAYESFPKKVAALMHTLAQNHALIDGNKRLAWAGARAFCLLNGKDIYLNVDEAEDLIMNIAMGKAGVKEILITISNKIY